jgi:hypothetical protein
MLSQEELKALIHYDPLTGIFTRNKGKRKGTLAGYINGRYCVIRVSMQKYYAHRLAFLYMTGRMPLDQVDHIDGDCTNNVWSNLRQATQSQNNMNRRLNKGRNYMGVRVRAPTKYEAYYRKDNIGYSLGIFATFEEAMHARVKAVKEAFGEFYNDLSTAL